MNKIENVIVIFSRPMWNSHLLAVMRDGTYGMLLTGDDQFYHIGHWRIEGEMVLFKRKNSTTQWAVWGNEGEAKLIIERILSLAVEEALLKD